MKRKAVFVSVLQIQSTSEQRQRYNGYASEKVLRIFSSMREYLATEEESFLSLMFQSYCNFTIAFINTRYVLLPHRKNRPLPLQVPWQPQPRPKQPGEAGHVPPVPPLETQRSCYHCTIAFPSSLNPAPLGLHLEHGEPELISGKQEKCEAIVSFFVQANYEY